MAKEDKTKVTTPAASAAKTQEKPKEPEQVPLKDVAKKAGLEPREARAMLRKMNIRPEDQKRSRWAWAPAEVDGVVAKLKAGVAAKAQEKEAKEKAAV